MSKVASSAYLEQEIHLNRYKVALTPTTFVSQKESLV